MICNVCFMLACIETQKCTNMEDTSVCVCCMYTMCTCIACDLIMYNVVCAIRMCAMHMIVFLRVCDVMCVCGLHDRECPAAW